MAKNASTNQVEAMGFTAMAADEEISATFYSIHIFEVQGFVAPQHSIITQPVKTAGVSYQIAAGPSVNDLCRSVAGDEYTDNEQKWAADRKCTPPYILVHVGPTATHSCKHGFIKRQGSQLHTYDAFPAAHAELLSLEELVLPTIHTALFCSALSAGSASRFTLVDRSRFGITDSHETLFDVRLELKAGDHAARPVSAPWLEATLASAAVLAANLRQAVARFIHHGLEGEDDIKRFLYCFLAVEIETHQVFNSIDHQSELDKVLGLPDRARNATLKALARHPSQMQNLADRFAWCTHCVWHHLSDRDVEDFLLLNKIRNRIAHGTISAPPPEAVVAIERLAAKLLGHFTQTQ